MAILDSTTKSLRIVLGEAKGTLDCDIVAFWGAQTSTGFQPASNDLVSNGTTAVTVVPAPGAGEQRQVNEVRLFNNDTITHGVTLQFDNNGTIRVIEHASVPPATEFLYTPSTTNGSSSGGSEWNAGTVDFLSSNLIIRAGASLDLADSISISGTASAASETISAVAKVGTLTVGSSTPFTSFSTHFSVTSATLDVTGFGTGSVTSVVSGAGLHAGTITTAGTLLADWNGGTVTTIGSDLLLSGGTLDVTTIAATSLFGNAATVSATPSAVPIGSGLSFNAGTLVASGASTSVWLYKANTGITSGTPPAGDLYWNNATQTSATVVALSHLTSDGTDVDLFIDLIVPGNTLVIQDQNDSANYQIWVCNGAITVHANSYVEVPVSLSASGGTGTTGFANNHQLFAALFTTSAAGTAGGVLSGTYPNPGFASIAATTILANSGSISAAPSAVPVGSGLSFSGGTLTATGSGGTVTQINTSGAGVSGGPITGTGTITVEWNAGTVSVIGTNLALTGNTLDLASTITVSNLTDTGTFSIGGTTGGTAAVGGTIFVHGGTTCLPLVINSNTAAPTVIAQTLVQFVGEDARNSGFSMDAFGGTNFITGRRSNGTQASPTALALGDDIVAIRAMGYGTAYTVSRALFGLIADEAWTGSANGTRFVWLGTPTGSTTQAEWARLTNGHLLLGTTTDNGTDTIQVNGSSTQTQIARTTTNAAAGYVGEYISATVTAAAAVALTSGTIATIGSVVLTAGDWDINGQTFLTSSNTLTTVNQFLTSINVAPGTINATPGFLAQTDLNGITTGSFGVDPEIVIIGNRVTAAGTYYLNCQVTFSVGTLAAYGLIQARRR